MTELERDSAKMMTRESEGYRSRPYTDTVGKTTIGYGRNLSANGIRHTEALYLFDNDWTAASLELHQYSWASLLAPAREAALTDMMYNIGPERFAEFRQMISACARQDWSEASRQMLLSVWHQEVGYRCERDAEMVRTGQWPRK